MRSIAILLAGFAVATASVALAGPETDFPHRDWGNVATLDMPAADAVSCIAREMDKSGSVLVLPTTGGTDIDYTLSGGLMNQNAGEPYMRFKVRADAAGVTLRAFYRRPLSQKATDKTIAGLQKRCLRVEKVLPVAP